MLEILGVVFLIRFMLRRRQRWTTFKRTESNYFHASDRCKKYGSETCRRWGHELQFSMHYAPDFMTEVPAYEIFTYSIFFLG
jgi:hypothetical protein